MNGAEHSDSGSLIYPVSSPFRAALTLRNWQGKLPAPSLVQVHGTTVIDGDEVLAASSPLPGDGLLICAAGPRGEWALRFADCFPVVVQPEGPSPSWLLVIHSGFAGTVKRIAACGVQMAARCYPETDLRKVRAWIGPGICFSCYERDEDELALSAASEWNSENWRREGGKIHFDIAGEIADQLAEVGLLPSKIERIPYCTRCRRDLFFSYRGGDRSERMYLTVQRISC